jgi:hypothetical protein
MSSTTRTPQHSDPICGSPEADAVVAAAVAGAEAAAAVAVEVAEVVEAAVGVEAVADVEAVAGFGPMAAAVGAWRAQDVQ